MRDAIEECELTGLVDGLAAGLALALRGVDTWAAPGGVAALASTTVPAGAPVLRHDLAAREGVTFVRPEVRRGAPEHVHTATAARLGAVRLGVTRHLAAKVVEHLSGRIAGGEPTLRKQLVQGTLADARIATETARRCLLAAGHVTEAVTDVHDRLTVLDWELAKLLGASGYVGDGPARTAYVSRLTANCWLPRDGAR